MYIVRSVGHVDEIEFDKMGQREKKPVEFISRIPLISVELILCYWSIIKMIGTGWLFSTLILILEVVASSC